MNKKYGYCRISTRKQNIDRQVRNIQALYPDAIIVKETYTGTKFQERKELGKILSKVNIIIALSPLYNTALRHCVNRTQKSNK